MSLRKVFGKKGAKTIKNGIWKDHPISAQMLGICSALAVSNKVENAIAMGAGVIFVLIATGLIISILRKLIPQRVRIISYMITISSFVIIVDKILQAFYPDISQAIGAYVGLIITNCIIMGRAEAFFIQNNVYQSLLDSVANGISYTYTLVSIAIVREVLAFGTILNFQILPDSFEKWIVMAMPAGAFFLVGVFMWITRTLAGIESK